MLRIDCRRRRGRRAAEREERGEEQLSGDVLCGKYGGRQKRRPGGGGRFVRC